MLGESPELNWNDMGDSCTEDLGESREYDAGDRLGVPTSLYLNQTNERKLLKKKF